MVGKSIYFTEHCSTHSIRFIIYKYIDLSVFYFPVEFVLSQFFYFTIEKTIVWNKNNINTNKYLLSLRLSAFNRDGIFRVSLYCLREFFLILCKWKWVMLSIFDINFWNTVKVVFDRHRVYGKFSNLQYSRRKILNKI